MWPWTHVAFGYVWYSIIVRLSLRRPPTDIPAVLAMGATLLPDLVDKPLAWSLGVTSTGYGPAHSVFVGLPIVLLLAAGLVRRFHLEYGIALSVGYASHLLGDVIFQYFDDGHLVDAVFIWPFAPATSESTGGVFEHVVYFLAKYAHAILTGHATTYVVLTVAIMAGVFVLWILDGKPGIKLLVGHPRRADE